MDGDNFFETYDSDDQSLRRLDELFQYYKICNVSYWSSMAESIKLMNGDRLL